MKVQDYQERTKRIIQFFEPHNNIKFTISHFKLENIPERSIRERERDVVNQFLNEGRFKKKTDRHQRTTRQTKEKSNQYF